jgi:hypothetical protein
MNLQAQGLRGIIHTIGALCQSDLKRDQGIKPAIAGLLEERVGLLIWWIYFNLETLGVNPDDAIHQVWTKVKNRNFVAHPGTGFRTVSEAEQSKYSAHAGDDSSIPE